MSTVCQCMWCVYHAHLDRSTQKLYWEDIVLVCVIKGKQGKELSSSSQSGRVSWDSNPSSWWNQNRLFPDPSLAPLGAVTVNPTSALLSSQSGCLRTCCLLDGQFEPLELSLLGSSQLTRPPPALEHSLPLRLCRETERLKELSPTQDLRGQLAREAQPWRPRPRFWLMDLLTLWSLISPSYKVEAIPVSHFFFFFGECEMKYFILKMFINSGFMWDCETNDYSVSSASHHNARGGQSGSLGENVQGSEM